eukprot:TRINITY_DN72698_c0_g1_i1.p5 TRINITY_DN72698_c0_g1~~TRINITY_DN72698_c0_g1_i1.p5  ORF type:complete len:105 (-),score=7.16 TRINITY_DN72698_c0_g1_i1:41-355(-)
MEERRGEEGTLLVEGGRTIAPREQTFFSRELRSARGKETFPAGIWGADTTTGTARTAQRPRVEGERERPERRADAAATSGRAHSRHSHAGGAPSPRNGGSAPVR